jgi:hypothetical protein
MENQMSSKKVNSTIDNNKLKHGIVMRVMFIWLISAFILSAATIISYTAMQQALRLSANWPQVQLAEDGAAAIASGQAASSVVPSNSIDIATSLAPFVIVYDAGGNVVASSGQLNGEAPKIPAGVLDYAVKNGEDRVSWTPNKDVRVAAVVEKIQGGPGGSILAGRSLRETERLINKIGMLLLAMWAGSVLLLSGICLVWGIFMKKNHK